MRAQWGGGRVGGGEGEAINKGNRKWRFGESIRRADILLTDSKMEEQSTQVKEEGRKDGREMRREGKEGRERERKGWMGKGKERGRKKREADKKEGRGKRWKEVGIKEKTKKDGRGNERKMKRSEKERKEIKAEIKEGEKERNDRLTGERGRQRGPRSNFPQACM